MIRKTLFGFSVFILAFGILLVSFLRSASPRYAFSQEPSPSPSSSINESTIDYALPYPGKILPDNPVWFTKAFRDRLWLTVTSNPSKKAEITLLYSNKRLVMSKMLFENQKPELAFSTLTKAEKYLEKSMLYEEVARQQGMDTTQLLTIIAKSALKHRELINEILDLAPGDAKPGIVALEDKPIAVYKKCAELLNSKGVTAPTNPFD